MTDATSFAVSPSAPPSCYSRRFNSPEEDPEVWHRLERGAYRAVYLAVPVGEMKRLLPRLAIARVNQVLVEKPWFADRATAEEVISTLRLAAPGFRYIDHYLERPVIRWCLEQNLQALLGGAPQELVGRLLEAPEACSEAMSIGVLRDQLVHLLSLVRRIAPACAVEVQNVRVARYRGAPYSSETFVHLALRVDASRPIAVTLTAAKGYPAALAAKTIAIRGPSATLELNLENETADLVGANRVRRLYEPDERVEDAYTRIVRLAAEGDQALGFAAEEILPILGVLDEARWRFPSTLPAYERDLPPAS